MSITARSIWVKLAAGFALVLAMSVFTGESSTSQPIGSNSGGPANAGTPKRGGTLIIGEDTQPAGGFDPMLAQAFTAKRMVPQFYEGLLQLGADGSTLEPALATSWEKKSDTSYLFTLRPSVKFHDGQSLTAADVVYSFNRLIDPAVNSPYAILYSLASVKQVGTDQVQIDLSKPQASLLHLLAQPWSAPIMSKSWTKGQSRTDLQTKENGTGPFKMVSFQQGSEIKTVRFTDYWDKGLPYLDGVNYRVIPAEATRVQAIGSGSVDMTQLTLPRTVPDLKRRGLTVGGLYQSSSYWMALNLLVGPLADKTVRQAISLGINRQQVVQVAGQGSATLGFTIPPADLLGSTPTDATPYYKYDPDQAKKLLAQANQKDLKISMIVEAEIPQMAVAGQIIKEQLSHIGVDLDLRIVPHSQISKTIFSRNWDVDIAVLPSVLNADASQYFTLWFGKGAPQTKVNDPKLWEMMEAAAETTKGDADRKARYLEISNYIAENVYQLVPYAGVFMYDVWSPKLRGFESDPTLTRFGLKRAWLN